MSEYRKYVLITAISTWYLTSDAIFSPIIFQICRKSAEPLFERERERG